MSTTLATNSIEIILLKYLVSINWLAIKIPNKGKIVKMAGYISQAAEKSPWNSELTARCNPQPGQSIPKTFFVKQGSIKSSNTKKKVANCIIRPK